MVRWQKNVSVRTDGLIIESVLILRTQGLLHNTYNSKDSDNSRDADNSRTPTMAGKPQQHRGSQQQKGQQQKQGANNSRDANINTPVRPVIPSTVATPAAEGSRYYL
jgi:hypothetical protein